jgi:hydroxymethylpyrimidine pyrophosphatase-like HAD family hydrolase
MDIRPKTIICDIDGTLVEHNSPSIVAKSSHKIKPLPNTLTKLEEWEAKGYNIILLTGRKESMRKVTEH